MSFEFNMSTEVTYSFSYMFLNDWISSFRPIFSWGIHYSKTCQKLLSIINILFRLRVVISSVRYWFYYCWLLWAMVNSLTLGLQRLSLPEIRTVTITDRNNQKLELLMTVTNKKYNFQRIHLKWLKLPENGFIIVFLLVIVTTL